LFSWLKNRRRRKLLRLSFPADWSRHIERNLRHYRFLDAPAKDRLRDVVRVVVAEKHFSGGGGLAVSDEMKVTVAAHAALLTLGLDEPYFFDHVQSIILHPGAYTHPPQMQGHYLVIHEQMPVYGEAWHRGPIVLSWQHVLGAGHDAGDAMNVVLHEFAHHLDGLDGGVEGIPPLAGRERRQTWYRVTEAEYLRLVGSARRGEATLLDHYGATNRAEFFAVATECFFERPRAMRDRHGELYHVLSDFYRQDPAAWLPDATSRHAPRAVLPLSEMEIGTSPPEEDEDAIDPRVFEATGPTELFTLGVDYLNDGEYPSAEAAFSRVLEQDPNDAEAYYHRAQARLQLEEYEQALADSTRSLELSPGEPDALRTLGGARLALEDYELAIDDLTRVLAEDPDDVEAHYLRGLAFNALRKPRQAIRDFSAVVRRDPHDAEAYYHRSHAHRTLGHFKKADADLEKALQLDPHISERGS
jgi:Mlc titration factor MtfA (ptsG expression regulator)/Flp pilus assembly protein TadD